MTRPPVRARFAEAGTSQGAKKGWETRKGGGGGVKGYTPPPGGAKGAQRSKDLDAAATAAMAAAKARGASRDEVAAAFNAPYQADFERRGGGALVNRFFGQAKKALRRPAAEWRVAAKATKSRPSAQQKGKPRKVAAPEYSYSFGGKPISRKQLDRMTGARGSVPGFSDEKNERPFFSGTKLPPPGSEYRPGRRDR